MKKFRKIGFSTLIGILAATSIAVGDEDKTSDGEEMSKLEKAMVKYDRTGEMKSCLSSSRIRHTRVVDDEHIIFEMPGSKTYLNTLPRRCPRLGYHKSIKYTVRGGSICKNDIFEVFDSAGLIGISCSFGEFEKLEKKKDKDDKKEAVSE